ncbi:MAG: NfeD family protein [Pyrinomonadaceae bacterium]
MLTVNLLFAGVAVLTVTILAIIAILSRHHKQSVRDLKLIGSRAVVATPLSPEGSVIVRGELWPARSRSGQSITRGTVVIAFARGHLLHVDPIE